MCALHAGTRSLGSGTCRDPALSWGTLARASLPPLHLRALWSRRFEVVCLGFVFVVVYVIPQLVGYGEGISLYTAINKFEVCVKCSRIH